MLLQSHPQILNTRLTLNKQDHILKDEWAKKFQRWQVERVRATLKLFTHAAT